MTAELLTWPHASGVATLTVEGRAFRVERPVEGAVEVFEGDLPAVISCDKGLNEPRYPSLKGIMAAKKKPIETLSTGAVGLDASVLDGGDVVVDAIEPQPDRPQGRIVGGSPEEAARELVRLLREEAKVI